MIGGTGDQGNGDSRPESRLVALSYLANGWLMFNALVGMTLAFSTVVRAQPAEIGSRGLDALEILRKVDEATKAVRSVRYTGRLEGKAAAASHVLTVEGTVVMSEAVPVPAPGGRGMVSPRRYRCEVRTTDPKTGRTRSLAIGCDGEVFYVIDHAGKKVYAGSTPGVLGTIARPAVALWLREFVHSTPFSDEINGDAQVLSSELKRIGEEDCYEIHVVYENAIGEAVWWFSTRDFLPRGVQRVMKTPAGERAIQQWQFTDLDADPELHEGAFKLVVPEGYERVDGNAP